MRGAWILPLALAASSCVHLDARPMDFACGPLLDGSVTTYQPTALFAQIQRDAGHDDRQGADLAGSSDLAPEAITAADPLVVALSAPSEPAANLTEAWLPPAAKVLMLSGGGSWGAFGAGFLRRRGERDWTAVTGISTGSLQGLFVAAGDYDRMVSEYSIDAESDLARRNSKLGIVRKGSQYDIDPLRTKLLAYLASDLSREIPFDRMARASAPDLFIGMVEASTGELKVVAVSRVVRQAYAGGRPEAAGLAALADCVAGVTLASSSIPVRLTPVRIDGKAYFDGGVRSSIFEAGVARRLAFAAEPSEPGTAPMLSVIRNGPTVVFRDKTDPDTDRPQVDVRPDLGRVGMRGYSTIVNQSELMSIAALRLGYPAGPIRVMTADGFNGPLNPRACGPRPEAVFDPAFMRCLVEWGERKAAVSPWIELAETD